MRYAILTSIAISQIGFFCTSTIFVSETLQAFVLAVTNCIRLISVQYFILIQLVIFLPLALFCNIERLCATALVADVFILAGLLYIFGSEVAIIANNGIVSLELFNRKDLPLLIGLVLQSLYIYVNLLSIVSTTVFSLEGKRLVSYYSQIEMILSYVVQVIPILDCMREPRKFPAVLTSVIISLMGVFHLPCWVLIRSLIDLCS